MSSNPAQPSWRSEIDALRAEARDNLRLDLIRPDEMLWLSSNVLVGDVMATVLVQGVILAEKTISAAPKAKSTLCACCPRPVRPSPDLMFGVVTTIGNSFSVEVIAALRLAHPGELEPPQ